MTGPADHMILVLGAPRSGTTWLAKIFDSHPDVLYRHEPDIVDRGPELPELVAPAETPEWRAAARGYLLRLAGLARLKTAGPPPHFAKSYRSAAGRLAQQAECGTVRLLERLPGLAGPAGQLRLHDFLAAPPGHVVLKSVSACFYAGLYAAALPEARIVFLVRDPLGQVASMRHGARLGKIDAEWAVRGLPDRPQAVRYGLAPRRFAALPLVERLAWLWVLLNEAGLAALAGNPAARLVAYRELRTAPLAMARVLFAFAGLAWRPSTEAFIDASTRGGGGERYFRVHRDTARAERKWLTELTPAERAGIVAIVRQSTLGRFLDDGAGG